MISGSRQVERGKIIYTELAAELGPDGKPTPRERRAGTSARGHGSARTRMSSAIPGRVGIRRDGEPVGRQPWVSLCPQTWCRRVQPPTKVTRLHHASRWRQSASCGWSSRSTHRVFRREGGVQVFRSLLDGCGGSVTDIVALQMAGFAIGSTAAA